MPFWLGPDDQQFPRYSWGHETGPSSTPAKRRISLPRGKRLGGSSSINGMIYVRGDRADFDSWAEQGAAGWSYDELLPTLCAPKTSSAANKIHPAWHGRGGPLTTNNLHNPSRIAGHGTGRHSNRHARMQGFQQQPSRRGRAVSGQSQEWSALVGGQKLSAHATAPIWMCAYGCWSPA